MVKPKSSTQLRHLEGVLKALANRRRLLMLATVRRQREIYVSALAEQLRLPVKTVSRNLRLLERAGLMQSDQRRGYVFYRLNTDAPSFSAAVTEAVEVGESHALTATNHSATLVRTGLRAYPKTRCAPFRGPGRVRDSMPYTSSVRCSRVSRQRA